MSGTTGPVVVEEEVEMVSLRVEYLVGEDVDEIAQCLFKTLVFPYSEQICIRFDDVQMSILRLWIIGIKVRQSHVFNLAPLSCASFYISIVFSVE